MSEDFERNLDAVLSEIKQTMIGRHKKYGSKNIAKHGVKGIQVRLDDKLARLEAGLDNHDDETVESTQIDVIGYTIIWMMWNRGTWPGSPGYEH